MDTEAMVKCPNCKGHKGWPVWDSPLCGMCGGRGEITQGHLRTLDSLRTECDLLREALREVLDAGPGFMAYVAWRKRGAVSDAAILDRISAARKHAYEVLAPAFHREGETDR